jgi:excinuclease ABC subunit B
VPAVSDLKEGYLSPKEIPRMVEKLRKEMKEAAGRLEFEQAAELRDKIHELEETELKMK